MIKESKKLNKLIDAIANCVGNDDFDLFGEIDADCYAMTNEDKCRIDHFDSHIRDGMDLVEKSYKTKKPIYYVYSEKADVIFYFVNKLEEIQNHLQMVLNKVQKELVDKEVETIKEMEEKLAFLKKKQKVKNK